VKRIILVLMMVIGALTYSYDRDAMLELIQKIDYQQEYGTLEGFDKNTYKVNNRYVDDNYADRYSDNYYINIVNVGKYRILGVAGWLEYYKDRHDLRVIIVYDTQTEMYYGIKVNEKMLKDYVLDGRLDYNDIEKNKQKLSKKYSDVEAILSEKVLRLISRQELREWFYVD